jgi:hypothetical protein
LIDFSKTLFSLVFGWKDKHERQDGRHIERRDQRVRGDLNQSRREVARSEAGDRRAKDEAWGIGKMGSTRMRELRGNWAGRERRREGRTKEKETKRNKAIIIQKFLPRPPVSRDVG